MTITTFKSVPTEKKTGIRYTLLHKIASVTIINIK